MANFYFDDLRNDIWNSTISDLTTLTIKPMLVDHADDTPVAADNFIDDILSAARIPAIASCPALGSKTNGVVGVGVFDGADSVFTALTGDQAESLIWFEDSGVESTSDLLAKIDTATGLPVTPNGADLTVQHAAGGIFTA